MNTYLIKNTNKNDKTQTKIVNKIQIYITNKNYKYFIQR